jgi:hypothetical protein
MSVPLPARYAVRDYLRQQGQRMDALASDMTGVLLNRWRDIYLARGVTTETIKGLAQEYTAHMSDAGGFGFKGEHIPFKKVSPQRERVSVSSFMLEPIGLGQGWWGDGVAPYVENAALLRSARAQFGRKKAHVGVGMGCVALTQHLLERVYERDEVDKSQLGPLIEREVDDLLRALALAEVASLWIERLDEGAACRVTAVPFSNGLMVANERLLFGEYADGDFGFNIEIPTGRMHTPFVNDGKLIEDLGERRYLRGDARPIAVTCGVTYMNVLTLDQDESDYFYGLKALMEEVGFDSLSALAFFTYAPSLTHEHYPTFNLQERFQGKVARLRRLLNAGWLKAEAAHPICYLLPYDHSIRSSA